MTALIGGEFRTSKNGRRSENHAGRAEKDQHRPSLWKAPSEGLRDPEVLQRQQAGIHMSSSIQSQEDMDSLSLANLVVKSRDRDRRAKFGDPGFSSSIIENMAMAAPNCSNARMHDRAAQLTIFYSGTVNVYDDMPAEMAQAIMTLAGRGENCEPSTISDEASVCSNSRDISSVPTPSTSATLNAAANMATETPASHTWLTEASSRSQSIAPPILAFRAPTKLAAGAHPMISSVGIERRQTPPGRLHADLPHARKVSLARFLEKRRSRLQVIRSLATNQRKKGNNNMDEGDSLPSEPATASKKRCIRPPRSATECPCPYQP